MTAADRTPFVLRRATGGFAEGAAKLAGEIGATAVEAVVAQANRTAVRRGAAGFIGTMKPGPVDWYAFDAEDQDTADWYPQGLTGSADSGEAGVPVFAVTWYFKPQPPVPERGIRLTFLQPRTLRYRHCLLVDAKPDGSYGPIDIHAGGCGWVGDLLYVADTGRGLRVFDLNNILDLRTAQPDLGDPARVGRHGGRFHAFGYRYVIPQTDFWLAGGKDAVFSFVGVDRDSGTLASGEYREGHGNGRVARWDLGGDGTLASGEPRDAFHLGVEMVQGAVSVGERWYLSQGARNQRNGRLVVGRPGEPPAVRPWVIGPEDLTVQDGRLWSVTEFRNRRAIFGVPL
ncbi:hypothetical protein [Thermoactinospora rubra]|uniref:hypothetical protein n=1 Tax=Thermoactinospora rubra TaxID=1088767 RepID=UPI000A102009|nr:hypothetical protein [Thermoactinospora rubra]